MPTAICASCGKNCRGTCPHCGARLCADCRPQSASTRCPVCPRTIPPTVPLPPASSPPIYTPSRTYQNYYTPPPSPPVVGTRRRGGGRRNTVSNAYYTPPPVVQGVPYYTPPKKKPEDMSPQELVIHVKEMAQKLSKKQLRELNYLKGRAARGKRTPTDEAYENDQGLEDDILAFFAFVLNNYQPGP